MAAYTGALARAAYYADPLAPPGASPDHGHDVSGDDVFTPPLDVEVHSGTVWSAEDEPAPMGDGPSLPTTHTGVRAVPVALGTPDWRTAYTGALIAAHEQQEYVSDARPIYHNATEGTTYEYAPDIGPAAAGIAGPDWFMVGPNGYDASNPPSAMYDGGRYRLGRRQVILGEYDQPGRYGQDAELRAVAFRVPYLPQATPPVLDPVGRTPTSSGITQWAPAAPFLTPQLYATPAPEAATDLAMVSTPAVAQFGTGDGEFQ